MVWRIQYIELIMLRINVLTAQQLFFFLSFFFFGGGGKTTASEVQIYEGLLHHILYETDIFRQRYLTFRKTGP